jgi:hypothetical protein
MFIILFLLVLSCANGYQVGHTYTFNYATTVKITTPKSLDLEISSLTSDLLFQPLRATDANSLIIKLTVC